MDGWCLDKVWNNFILIFLILREFACSENKVYNFEFNLEKIVYSMPKEECWNEIESNFDAKWIFGLDGQCEARG